VVEELGLFYRGTRHLSQLEMLVGGEPPFFLSARVTPDNVRTVANLTNGDLREGERLTPRSTISLRRTTLLSGAQMLVRVVLHSFHEGPLRLGLAVRFAADFADLFQVRGVRRTRAGTMRSPRVEDGAQHFGYVGADGVARETRCVFVGAE